MKSITKYDREIEELKGELSEVRRERDYWRERCLEIRDQIWKVVEKEIKYREKTKL